ncbi:mitogen-activated protein kinase kinase PBS2 Ecym_5209 [Eremothecium cymbalariae DBVPG|uniref:mitogen-activated protein kinase kinase n=1 Tax=Eremothecium cymbalariae (strain CBS 270.75 / DBVPG 7215 / KCTC 17166 / NRRL Y-17582) TaxID=931890 RepID=I6ND36_ERECY|nr:hypothetical protein Ecym_5209 [Eremothecium cymbalariae DBVPG\
MERTNVQRSGSVHSGSSASKNYSNINANLHARVKAFQEQRKLKRSGSVGSKNSNPNQPQDSSSIQQIVNKPLPPLPPNKSAQVHKAQQQREHGKLSPQQQQQQREEVGGVGSSQMPNLRRQGSSLKSESRPNSGSSFQQGSPSPSLGGQLVLQQDQPAQQQESEEPEELENAELSQRELEQVTAAAVEVSRVSLSGQEHVKPHAEQQKVQSEELSEQGSPVQEQKRISDQQSPLEQEQDQQQEPSSPEKQQEPSPPEQQQEQQQEQKQEQHEDLQSQGQPEEIHPESHDRHYAHQQHHQHFQHFQHHQHHQHHNNHYQQQRQRQLLHDPQRQQQQAETQQGGHITRQQHPRPSCELHNKALSKKASLPILPLNPIRRAPRPPDVAANSTRTRQPPQPGIVLGVQGTFRTSTSCTSQGSSCKSKPSLSARRGMKLPSNGMPLKMKQPPQEFASQPSNKNVNTQANSANPTGNKSSRSNPGSLTNGIQTTSTSSEKQVDTEGTEPSKSSNSGSNSNGGLFAVFSKYVDIKSGSLNFAGKLSLSSQGVDFSNGSSFRITLDELEFLEELGHGNYGTVSKVLHKPTNIMMAMKEVRLELDESKFRQILMELEVLHKCQSSYIVDFYGAFFIEGAVYMCMEFMNGGSLDKSYDQNELGGFEEPQLAFITEAVIRGLKELKDIHNIIHRDVKPTNILCSASQGTVKLCDFGVSGNLVASLAKTNIGCQSYMAPERIKSLNPDKATYSVQSDIWSLGLSIVEMALGAYPYPPETYDNIFSQLSAIVDGPPPRLPKDKFSSDAQDFVAMCLQKIPERRPTYAALLDHPWLKKYHGIDVHMSDYISNRLTKRQQYVEQNGEGHMPKVLPALHMGGL